VQDANGGVLAIVPLERVVYVSDSPAFMAGDTGNEPFDETAPMRRRGDVREIDRTQAGGPKGVLHFLAFASHTRRMTPRFVIALIVWFVAIVGLLITASRLTETRPRLAFGMLMLGLMVMLWGVLFVMIA
jgi:hypothetical protein